jgi:Spy/CpxP family protein refolding chaperone
MTKVKLILAAAFVVTLLAGGVAGFALRSFGHRHPPRPSPAGGPRDPGARPPREHFPDLQLTAEQAAKMDEIWNALRDFHRFRDQRQAVQKQREEAVRAILTQEQKAKYDAVLKDYADKIAELGKAREKAFQEAVEKTKLILNAAQRKKYEEWLKSMPEDRRPGGPPPELKGPPPTRNEEHTAPGSAT